MRTLLIAAAHLAVLLFAIPVTGQDSRIEGDLYLVTEAGDVRVGAANIVYLVPATPQVQKDWDSVCADDDRNSDDVLPALMDHAAMTSTTGMNAHFLFESVSPGDYFLVAIMGSRARGYTYWIVPVELSADQEMTVNLDNLNSPAILCRRG